MQPQARCFVVWACSWAVALSGCAVLQPPHDTHYPNPVFVPAREPEGLWQHTVDVVDDYFQIDHEDRVRQIGETQTVGRIDTFAAPGATLLEPWLADSVGAYELTESTLQNIQRRAVVQVMPTEGGYLVDVSVFKELQDVQGPSLVTPGGSTLRNDTSLQRYRDPISDQPPSDGWIPQGRDTLLEQRILAEIAACSGVGPQSGQVARLPRP